MRIIGIGGTNGSGKDTVGEMLAERHGFLVVSVSEILREEARRRGLSIERKNLSSISAQWRREFGHGVLTDKAVEIFDKSSDSYAGLVVIPMRHPGEADKVKELGGKLIWVDGDSKVRYRRIISRNRSSEDDKTYEEFMAEEQREMHRSSDDAATLSGAEVKKRSDIFMDNSGNDIEAFKDEAEKALGLV